MKRVLLRSTLVALMVGLAPGLLAQDGATERSIDPEKEAAILTLFKVTRTGETMLSTFEAAMQEEPVDEDLPEGFNEALVVKAREDVGEFLGMLVPLYDELYTLQQIEDQIAFYRTPTGQAVVAAQGELMERIMAVGEQWGMILAGEVIVKLAKQRGVR
jgi:hypothetical protein